MCILRCLFLPLSPAFCPTSRQNYLCSCFKKLLFIVCVQTLAGTVAHVWWWENSLWELALFSVIWVPSPGSKHSYLWAHLLYLVIFKLFIHFYFMCVGVLFASLCTTCVQCWWRPAEGIRFPRTGVKSCGCWFLNPGSLKEQSVL